MPEIKSLDIKSYNIKVSFGEIIDTHKSHHRSGAYNIKKAYEYASAKHENVYRGTGEPYINHPLRVARLMADWGFESDVIIAALLHDVVEDCDTPLSEISDLFGTDVSEIVDAVTALSDKEFDGQDLSKRQKDLLSDVQLQKKMNEKALYVKIADRIDNLCTLSGVPEEKRIPKAIHTQNIIIPMAKIENAYHFVDVLEELCFQIEKPNTYERIQKRYRELRHINVKSCHESLEALSIVFDPIHNRGSKELAPYQRFIKDFFYQHRSKISIFRQIVKYANNLEKELPVVFSKDHVALYDCTLLVSDELTEQNSRLRPNDIFFKYYKSELSKRGLYLIQYLQTTHNDAGYYLLSDETDNLYRLFVRTENEYQRFLYGNIIDENTTLKIENINEDNPEDTFKKKIKVYKKDGSELWIDEGATVLDYAFYIHSDLGYHFSYAINNETNAKLPAYTRLNDGDSITIIDDYRIAPEITWFNYTKTSKATHFLVKYFQKALHNLDSGRVSSFNH